MEYVLLLIIFVILFYIVFKSKPKKKKSYGVQSKTVDGITVRSKKEKVVADYLVSEGIEYEYEREIKLDGDYILSDFYLPKYDTYIEYWGLDKLKNETGDKYRERKEEKIELYAKHKLKLISLSEEDIPELNRNFKKKLKELQSGSASGLRGLLFGKSKSMHCTDCGIKLPADSKFCTDCGASF